MNDSAGVRHLARYRKSIDSLALGTPGDYKEVSYRARMVRGAAATAIVCSTCVLCAHATTTNAENELAVLPDRIRIIYTAPDACPARAALIDQVTARVKIPWIADDTEQARHIWITLTAGSADFIARMEYTDGMLRPVVRVLNAQDCHQAVSAIALVTALAIDSQAVRPGPTNLAPLTSATPTPVASVSSGSVSAQPAERQPWSQEAGIRLGVAAGIAPSAAMNAAVFWGIGPKLLPRIRLSASWHDRQATPSGINEPRAHFSLFSLVPQLCWGARLGPATPIAVAGCGGVELGLYRVQGVSPDSDSETEASATRLHSRNLLWASVLLSLPLRFTSRDVFFELVPDIRAPLVRGRFEFQTPYRSVHTIPPVAVGLGLGTGLSFP